MPAELMSSEGTAVAAGVLGVVIPLASGFLLFRLTGCWTTEPLFLGAALAATSVGITDRVLSATGLLHRTAARIILGAAVVDDILALLLLGAVSSFAEGRANLVHLGLTSIEALVFINLIGRWGGRTMGAVMPHLQNGLRLGESQFAMAMILLFELAALS